MQGVGFERIDIARSQKRKLHLLIKPFLKIDKKPCK